MMSDSNIHTENMLFSKGLGVREKEQNIYLISTKAERFLLRGQIALKAFYS